MKHFLRLIAFASALAVLSFGQEKVDLEAIYKIKQEAFQKSQVMDYAFWLTDAKGPRLAGSPNYQKAGEWAAKTLTDLGLQNVKLDKWGPFGKSWENKKFYVALQEPSYQPIYGFPMAWTPSTPGMVTGEPVLAVIRTEADMEKWKGKLKGKIVFTEAMRELQPVDKPFLSRYTEQQLQDMEKAPEPGQNFMRGGPPAAAGQPAMNFQQMQAFRRKLTQFWIDEGAAVLVQYGYRNDGGTMAGAAGGNRDPKEPVPPPMIIITPEHYNRIVRLLDHKVPVKLDIDVQNEMGTENADSFNVIAEIPGTGKHKDEIVMIGGHLDSWHGGTGATDNAAGTAVMMEAMRILKSLNLPLDRTVRIGLWGAEEQGLLGSRAYVKEHLADRETMKTTKAWDNFSAYYNIDNGTGKIRGIYLQGNEMARPVFDTWLAPFKDLGVQAETIRNTGGTDHQSFDAVGLPGFQFIQDPVEYSTRTHHSNMDVYDRLQKPDMMQMSAIVASLVYNTANREEKMPRKPKPAPQPAGQRGAGGPPSF